MSKDWYVDLIGLGVIGVIAMSLTREESLQPIPIKYAYNMVTSNLICKDWQYIEAEPYRIILYNGESISINVTYNLQPGQIIDIVDIRFHNICSTLEGYGKIYAYVNGRYALPTIGVVNNKIPIYLGFPPYPDYGTVFTTVWDTDDVKGSGTYNYTYTYEGNTPLYIKSLELYVTNKL